MTSQWSALTNQRPLFHTRYFCYTIEKFHGTFHTCMNSYVEDFKISRNISYVYEFIRRRFHTRIKSNAFETIRVCKIPWMILHNDTRIKSYTYEKLHVWKVTRMQNYTYEKLHVLNIELWLVHCYTRIDSFTELLIRVCFLTWIFIRGTFAAFCPLRPTIGISLPLAVIPCGPINQLLNSLVPGRCGCNFKLLNPKPIARIY